MRPGLALAWHAAPRLLLLQFSVSVLLGIVPAGLLILTQRLIDAAAEAALGAQEDLLSTDLTVPLVAWIGLNLLTALADNLDVYVRGCLRERVSHYVQTLIVNKVASLDVGAFERADVQDAVETARREAAYRPGMLVEQTSSLLQSVSALLALVGVILLLDWWLICLIGLVAVPTFGVEWRYGQQLHRMIVGQASGQRKIGYLMTLLTTEQAAKEIRLYRLHELLAQRFRNTSEVFVADAERLMRRRLMQSTVTGVISGLAAIGGFLLVFRQVLRGQASVGMLYVTYQGIRSSQQAVDGIALAIAGLHQHALFVKHLERLLALEPEQQPLQQNPVVCREETSAGLILRNVSFTYPDTDRPILHEVSLQLRYGEVTALLGANGAGKSTLVKVVAGLYPISNGNVLLNGQDVRELAPGDYQRQVAVLFQDFVRYQFTLYDNVAFGCVECLEDRERVEHAAVELGQLIARLPAGLDTQLGRWFADGYELSAGQWQRVAVARTLAGTADILILDEPTAWLDPHAERQLYAWLGDWKRERIVIVVSHRREIVRYADRVVWLDQGRVMADGSHEELCRENVNYAQWFGALADQVPFAGAGEG